MATTQSNAPGPGGFFSLFNLPPRVFRSDALDALGQVMGRARREGAAGVGAGYVYLGQFVAHDVTRLKASGSMVPVAELEQERTPALDLDSIYGTGFDDSRIAIDQATGEMRIGEVVGPGGQRAVQGDLPRNADRTPRIGDDRNDENLFLAQLHVSFLKLHNFFLARLRKQSPRDSPRMLFEQARSQLILHYQHVVLYDLLETVLDPRVWHHVIGCNTGTIWNPSPAEAPRMPIEFAAAAFRFGHSMVGLNYLVRGSQRIDLPGLFQMTGAGGFGGQAGLPQSHVVDWSLFFHSVHGRPPANEALRIDPVVPVAFPDGSFLAVKNLLSGNRSGLPDGQTLIRHVASTYPFLASLVQLRELSANELNPVMKFKGTRGSHHARVLDEAGSHYGFETCTPLWYYILAEAQAVHDGRCLGPLGSLIVAEVVRALVYLSQPSILRSPFESGFIVPTKDMRGRRYLRAIDLLNAVA